MIPDYIKFLKNDNPIKYRNINELELNKIFEK